MIGRQQQPVWWATALLLRLSLHACKHTLWRLHGTATWQVSLAWGLSGAALGFICVMKGPLEAASPRAVNRPGTQPHSQGVVALALALALAVLELLSVGNAIDPAEQSERSESRHRTPAHTRLPPTAKTAAPAEWRSVAPLNDKHTGDTSHHHHHHCRSMWTTCRMSAESMCSPRHHHHHHHHAPPPLRTTTMHHNMLRRMAQVQPMNAAQATIRACTLRGRRQAGVDCSPSPQQTQCATPATLAPSLALGHGHVLGPSTTRVQGIASPSKPAAAAAASILYNKPQLEPPHMPAGTSAVLPSHAAATTAPEHFLYTFPKKGTNCLRKSRGSTASARYVPLPTRGRAAHSGRLSANCTSTAWQVTQVMNTPRMSIST